MNIQAKVALDKEKHPERFCKETRCLWRVVKLDHATQTYHPLANCPGGRCPRHQNDRRENEDLGLVGSSSIPWSSVEGAPTLYSSMQRLDAVFKKVLCEE